MADDESKTGLQDSSRININDDCEVRAWSEKLGVTPQELRETVRRVGDRAEHVERYLMLCLP